MDGGKTQPKSVRFDAAVGANQKKRPRGDDDDDLLDRKPAAKKAYKDKHNTNQDELDDVDDYEREQDDDDVDDTMPSERELLEVKRKRRHKAAHMEDSESTHIDDKTSLASEGIAIEPFHMDREQSDGTGYFDGDTYVFRKNREEGEDDAWLDQLDENDDEEQVPSSKIATNIRTKQEEEEDVGPSQIERLSKQELYEKILPLVSDTESVAQAVQRYGAIMKQRSKAKETDSEMYQMAKKALDDLTEAANALLFKGDVNIYDTTRNDILKQSPADKVPAPTSSTKNPVEKQKPAKWEYKGNQDGQIHGPYTTEQMIGWTKSGYFVGAQAVQIRTIRDAPLSTQDDLMADLMDDSDDDDNGAKKEEERGEWMSSDKVNFEAYLP
jgi:CD2 antigen cytoplasmic tail-binding protein 2